MNGTAVLYALSTLAQTCAALAAFVGAVGLYRIQALKEERRAVYEDIYARRGRPSTSSKVVLDEAVEHSANDPLMRENLDRYNKIDPTISSSRCWLVVFEGWNLLVILFSLVGFAYVPWLTGASSLILWVAALGTVGVTGYSVFTWVRV